MRHVNHNEILTSKDTSDPAHTAQKKHNTKVIKAHYSFR